MNSRQTLRNKYPLILARNLQTASDLSDATLHASHVIYYELDTDKIKLFIPANLTFREIYADICAMLKKVKFATIFDNFSFLPCTQTLIRLYLAGVTIEDFKDTVFPSCEKIVTDYFKELEPEASKHQNNLIEFLDTEFKKIWGIISVVPLDSSAQVQQLIHRNLTIAQKEQFWNVYLGKLLAAVFAVILLVFLVVNIFSENK